MGCPGCGLPNYEVLCPVCRGDMNAYQSEIVPWFGDVFGVLTTGSTVTAAPVDFAATHVDAGAAAGES